jgi:hypothetical protein
MEEIDLLTAKKCKECPERTSDPDLNFCKRYVYTSACKLEIFKGRIIIEGERKGNKFRDQESNMTGD